MRSLIDMRARVFFQSVQKAETDTNTHNRTAAILYALHNKLRKGIINNNLLQLNLSHEGLGNTIHYIPPTWSNKGELILNVV